MIRDTEPSCAARAMGTSDAQMFPEMVEYLSRAYDVERRLGSTLILKAKPIASDNTR